MEEVYDITVGMLIDQLADLDPDMPVWALAVDEHGQVQGAIEADVVQFVHGGIYIASERFLIDETTFDW